ncbi:hypothetical protein WOLCODRAFT_29382 [Wolfiporia cocos MD-104 SS10]|uniref:Uncharacterized protein n=1 Tax=Wolfiporia cocos (strain MD-104) TaxID=742152 RepID=A0A2H3JB09_WOLCO|nr:hypothetical protein WOLCODRAFT_168133 [Wolfiporia cocos MD-104 SS10]PCH39091.1 hypothetical protein WOLCODRAFT_29382 [Wolfiporia cocos MD-104 SS10]
MHPFPHPAPLPDSRSGEARIHRARPWAQVGREIPLLRPTRGTHRSGRDNGTDDAYFVHARPLSVGPEDTSQPAPRTTPTRPSAARGAAASLGGLEGYGLREIDCCCPPGPFQARPG